jgi:oligopeptide transport system substrate-binding protein
MLSRKSLAWALSVLTLMSLLVTACGGTPPTPVTVIQTGVPVVQTAVVTAPPEVRTQIVPVTAVPAEGAKALRLNFGVGDVPTIDPAVSEDSNAIQIVEMTTVGLTRQNEETAAVEPGLAESWEISEDGRVYTFKLMEGVPWVKYNPSSGAVEKVLDADGAERTVTARDFEYGILRTLDPATASPSAYVLAAVLAGAADYNAGVVTDTATVGVRAIDDVTLEVTLNEPASFAPNILGMWMARAQPQWLIEERGDRWIETGFQQSYGPYSLKSWNHDADMTLIKNPFWPGIPSVPQAKIEELYWTMLDETPAFTNYETGESDVVNVPQTDIDRVKADDTLSKELNIAPVLCTYYYGFNVEKAPFDDARVRRAFSMAIDRQALIDNVTKGGQEPAQWFSRPGLQAAPTIESHPDLGVKYDPEGAKALLDEVFPDRAQMPPISLMVNQVEGHVRIAEAIAAMWNEVLGVEVTLSTQEWQVFLDTLANDPPQIFRAGWCQDYPDAHNFLHDVFHSSSAQSHTNWVNEEFDQLVVEAGTETDQAKRLDMYVQAEQLLIEQDAAIIPIYWYTRVTVTKPYVERTYSVLGGMEHYEKWDIKQ